MTSIDQPCLLLERHRIDQFRFDVSDALEQSNFPIRFDQAL